MPATKVATHAPLACLLGSAPNSPDRAVSAAQVPQVMKNSSAGGLPGNMNISPKAATIIPTK